MKNHTLKIVFVIGGILISGWIPAQTYLNQVIVLNEGRYDYFNQVQTVPVTISAYNPTTKSYAVFDTIENMRFGSDVIVDSQFIYVAADSLLIKYDANTLTKTGQVSIPGIRELTLWNYQVLVTRGEYGVTFPSYFQVYDKNTLAMIYEITNISGSCAEVRTVNDTAYIAVNDFGNMGKMALIDLNNQLLAREIDLGVDGMNPEAVRVEGNRVFTVNSMDWTNSSITDLDAMTGTFQTAILGTGGNCGASTLYAGNIYFQVYGENRVGVFDLFTKNVWDTLTINENVYGFGIDPVNGLIYAGITDYVSFGKVTVFDLSGNRVDSFAAGVSPGTFAFDVRQVTGIEETGNSNFTILSPNPVSGKIEIENHSNIPAEIILYNIIGEKAGKQILVNGKNRVDCRNFLPGIYFYMILSENGLTAAGKILVE